MVDSNMFHHDSDYQNTNRPLVYEECYLLEKTEEDHFQKFKKAPQDLEESLQRLFDSARGQIFEDGMETKFSQELTKYIISYGEVALSSIDYLIHENKISDPVLSECLRWLGRIRDKRLQSWILYVLQACLFSKSAIIRDGALLGIASLDTKKAIKKLQEASRQEICPELQKDMIEVLSQLEKK